MHPILFWLGPIPIGSYGICVLSALAFGVWLSPRYAARYGIDPTLLRRFFVRIFVAGFLGCRLTEILVRLPEVIANPNPRYWIVSQAGVWYGAIIGGIGFGAYLIHRNGWNAWTTFDAAAVPAVIGGGIGRIGCLLAGCCWGTPTDLPWAIRYTNPLAHEMQHGLPSVPLHPTVVYESLGAFAIGFLLDRLGRHAHVPGTICLLWLILYGVLRSMLEMLRGDTGRGVLLLGLSTSQTIGLLSATGALVLLVVRWRQARTARGSNAAVA